ncbi:hypothetical protein RRF57_011544 [Xylaria bambusicola]|uniref:Uncharacterized protein n=1 Tax=Xylaria bambusicola TaxID=326684 RepID=A0AAN7UV41_9PEZI
MAGTLTNWPLSKRTYGKSRKKSPSIQGVQKNRSIGISGPPGKGAGTLAACSTSVLKPRRQAIASSSLSSHPVRCSTRSNCHSNSSTNGCAGKNTDSPTAPTNNLSPDSGSVALPPCASKCSATDPPPADAPWITTWSGSPPNCAICRLTQRIMSRWSSKPAFKSPSARTCSLARKPQRPTR